MDISEIIEIFNNLPDPVLPSGPNFSLLETTLQIVMGGWSTANDTINNNWIPTPESDKILDAWGIFLGIPREYGDAAAQYLQKLKLALSNSFGTVGGIETFLSEVSNIQSSISNASSPQSGYTISLASSSTPTIISNYLKNLVYARPAGVPFSVTFLSGGVFANGSSYVQANNPMTGGNWTTAYSPSVYLGGGSPSQAITIPANTNNVSLQQANFPYFNDPSLTGQISVG